MSCSVWNFSIPVPLAYQAVNCFPIWPIPAPSANRQCWPAQRPLLAHQTYARAHSTREVRHCYCNSAGTQRVISTNLWVLQYCTSNPAPDILVNASVSDLFPALPLGMKEVADMFSTFDYVKELQARLPTIGYLRKDTMNDEWWPYHKWKLLENVHPW